MSEMRQEFEKFCRNSRIDTEIDSDPYWKGDKYASPYTQGAWTAWQYLYGKCQSHQQTNKQLKELT